MEPLAETKNPSLQPAVIGRIGLACLLAFAAVLRLTGLGSEPFWMDEGYTMAYTSPPFFRMIEFIATRDVHPPLYYIIMKFWQQFGSSEPFLRFPSVVFGVLAVWAVWSLADENWGRLPAFASGAILAVSESAIWYSQEVRMYSLVLLFTALSLKYCLRFLSAEYEVVRRDSVLLCLTTLGLLYSHNLGVLFWLSQGLFMCLWRLVRYKDSNFRRTYNKWFISQIITAALYLPWLLVFISQRANVEARFWTSPPNIDSVWAVFNIALAYKSQGLIAGLLISFLPFVLLIRTVLSFRDPRLLLTAACFVLPMAAAYQYSIRFTSIFVDRTLLFIAIPLIILCGTFLGSLSMKDRFLPMKIIRWIIGLVVILSLIAVNLRAWDTERRAITKEDFRTAAANAAAYAGSETAVIFNNAASQAAFDFYFDNLDAGNRTLEISLPTDYLHVPRGNANLEPPITYDSIMSLDGRLAGKNQVVLVRSHYWYTDPQQLVKGYFDSRWIFAGNLSVPGVEMFVYHRY